jgi:N-acetylglucosaminyldiphosphoundecaprenol N-acetyl-beta-D-mannosaminyltransferase
VAWDRTSDPSSPAARPPAPTPSPSRMVVGMRVDATSYRDACDRIVSWILSGDPAYVCVASVNNVIEARDDPSFRASMNEADLVTPDGRPLAWALRWLGISSATQVRGTDLTDAVLRRAASEEIPVGFYGSTDRVLTALLEHAGDRWPGLKVAYRVSPPFREPTSREDADAIERIGTSGAKILFVGLGCPKQEIWMARHHEGFTGVMLGVGAAFDFLAGKKKQAPRALQRWGLEWLFRLATEPRRLWKRYLSQNPRFIALFVMQVLRSKVGSDTERR